ncbi:helix-turn-helix domain-containing protein [Streptomyces sp. NPDC059651]|uniref:helix-turn-helix domain-containing protein n=1 Tax=Streptomyces sp. NPDC059651 TaxID=3346897 RepID=UPI00369F4FF4
MRYAQGGGLTDAKRAARERLRLQTVKRFEGGQKNTEVATALRISLRSVARWRWSGGAGSGASAARRGCCRRGLREDLGSAKPSSPRWSVSWSAAHSPTGGWTSGGHWHGSRP